MAIKKIVTVPDSILRKKSLVVEKVDKEITYWIEYMIFNKSDTSQHSFVFDSKYHILLICIFLEGYFGHRTLITRYCERGPQMISNAAGISCFPY
mgnify:CR=1 FL=1